MSAVLSLLWSLLQPILGDLLKQLIITKKVEITEKTDAQRVPLSEVRADRYDDLLARRAAPRSVHAA